MTPQVGAVSVLINFLRTKEEEVGQRKACTIKARLPQAGKSDRKPDKQGNIININGGPYSIRKKFQAYAGIIF